MSISSRIARSTWSKALLLVSFAGLVAFASGVITLDRSDSPASFALYDSLACVRPDAGLSRALDRTSVASVRNIVDREAGNYYAPTDGRWGVLGRFPGDTTIMVEQGQYLVAARLFGQPSDSLSVQWGSQTFPIVAVYGGGFGWKQRYITVHDDRHFVLPIQWNEQSSTWEPYGVERWFEVSGPAIPGVDESLEGRCSDCHREDGAGSNGVVFVESE